MKRLKLENNDLTYNLRINGRIFMACTLRRFIEDIAYQMAREHPDATVDLEENSNLEDAIILRFLPRDADTVDPEPVRRTEIEATNP